MSGMKRVVSFCYHKAHKIKGVHATLDNQSILLFYRKSLDYFSWRDIMRYVRLAVCTIGVARIKPIYDRETQVSKIRQKECDKQGDRITIMHGC